MFFAVMMFLNDYLFNLNLNIEITNVMKKFTLVNGNKLLCWPDYQKEQVGGTFGSPTLTVQIPGILRLTLSTFVPNTSPQRALS